MKSTSYFFYVKNTEAI